MNFMKKLNIKHHLLEYKRIIKISKKPSKKEFEEVLKITGIGTIIVGFIGFVIQLLFQLVEVVLQ